MQSGCYIIKAIRGKAKKTEGVGIKSDVQRKQKFNFENFYSRSFNYSHPHPPKHEFRKQYLKNSCKPTQQNFAIQKNARFNMQFFNRKQSHHR